MRVYKHSYEPGKGRLCYDLGSWRVLGSLKKENATWAYRRWLVGRSRLCWRFWFSPGNLGIQIDLSRMRVLGRMGFLRWTILAWVSVPSCTSFCGFGTRSWFDVRLGSACLPFRYDVDDTSSGCSGILSLILRVGNLCRLSSRALLLVGLAEFAVVIVQLDILKRKNNLEKCIFKIKIIR